VKVEPNPQLPQHPNLGIFTSKLMDVLRKHAYAINDKHEGTSVPTTGKWLQGNFVWNTAPLESGLVGNQYVIIGWICTVSGEPGTWVECRCLTGN